MPYNISSSHHSYFEDLIATAVAADAEANAPTEELLTEKERAEVAELRQAVDGLADKYEGILDSLRVDEVRDPLPCSKLYRLSFRGKMMGSSSRCSVNSLRRQLPERQG